MNSTRAGSARRPATWLWRALVWAVLLVLVIVLLGAVVVPRLAGATPYSILTGSMTPAYPPGTLVVVKPTDIQSLSTGDVITYQLRSGESTVVTHRIVSQGFTASGDQPSGRRGTPTTSPMQSRCEPCRSRASFWYSMPYVGRVNDYITGQERQLAMISSVSFLLLYAAYMFTSAALDRRRTAPRHVST
ncbi:signal peptidase I [Aeromicrobium sp. UC242_57]|uniref:signal peptidase I n=1 Tax=Aeromicrobium sp. UC242_57 TaxID=3374624 RepID=UPI0037AD7CEC